MSWKLFNAYSRIGSRNPFTCVARITAGIHRAVGRAAAGRVRGEGEGHTAGRRPPHSRPGRRRDITLRRVTTTLLCLRSSLDLFVIFNFSIGARRPGCNSLDYSASRIAVTFYSDFCVCLQWICNCVTIVSEECQSESVIRMYRACNRMLWQCLSLCLVPSVSEFVN